MGLGFASGLDHEVSGSYFLQLNLQQILASNPSWVTLGLGSLQSPDAYNIWGSNQAGTPGKLIASNQTGSTFNLSDLGKYRYISISAASPDDSVLLTNVFAGDASGGGTTKTPEPGSASLLVAGLAALAGILIAKKL
jgi:hypothetical protein